MAKATTTTTKRNFKKFKKQEKTVKTHRDYIDKEEFYNAIVDYNRQLKEAEEKGLPEPRASDYIGKCIIDIVDKILTSHRFKGYTDLWKDEMRSEGILSSIKSLKNFNPEKSQNPFSYFTTAVYYTFYNVIDREKKYHKTATEYNTETHSDYTNIGADGFHYDVPEQVHDKLVDQDIDMLDTKAYRDDIKDYNTWFDDYQEEKEEKSSSKISIKDYWEDDEEPDDVYTAKLERMDNHNTVDSLFDK